jgi:hypothetical protein
VKKVILGIGAVALMAGGWFGGGTASADTGHTPVVVCHWVPAAPAGAHPNAGPEGGSYVVITVDDDAANGNRKLQAHAGHEHDIIGADETDCGFVEED